MNSYVFQIIILTQFILISYLYLREAIQNIGSFVIKQQLIIIVIIFTMKNFDPVGSTRQKWYDPKHIKNRPFSCDKTHSFCNIEYQWATEGGKMKPINRPINPSIPNVDLPVSREKVISVNYDSMTQQNLDDWVAQSLNRSLVSMLNPQKKFFLPTPFDEQLRHRYRKKKQLTTLPDSETYFDTGRKKKKGYFTTDRKQKVSANDLCFDYRKLQPHQDLVGIPIKIRQMKKIQKKQIKRRNAVLLSNDVHYARFLKESNKQKSIQIEAPVQEQQVIPTKKMIYSYNLESLHRKSCYDNVPCSLIEKEYERIKQPQKDLLTAHRALMNKQQQLHEKYRIQMNEKATAAINQMKQMSTGTKPVTGTQSLLVSSYKKNITLTHKTVINQSHGQMQKDKKYLQNKIIKILNDMQVQAEAINEDMARLNIHVNQIFLQHPDSRPQTKWILKAQQKIKDHKNLLAIDCYKQAIILQPELFIPVFNIAVLLQRQNMLQSSRQWFNLARQFQTDSQNVLFGISLVALKQLRYNESLLGISQLINKLQTSQKKVQSVYYYIRALCNKQLGFFKQAKQDYKTIQNEFKPTNFNVLPDFIFSVVFARLRRIHLKFNCLSYMLMQENIYLIMFENKKKIKDFDQNLIQIADKLVKSPFFCRFSISLVKKLLSIATYEQKEKGELIFRSKNTTSIIINGLVSLKSHQKQYIKPQMVSVLSRGGLIGAGNLQNNISQRPNSWFTAESKVQMITVPRDDFQMFWKGQITFQVDFKYCFLKYVDIFKGLSECTLLKLCQLFQKKTYQRGQILFNDCSYRSEMISRPGKGYGFAKFAQKTDARMLHSGGASSSKQVKGKQRRKSKIYKLIKKHLFKFNELKFSRLKYPGMFVVLKGMIELEDDRGFRCNGMIGQRDFFGENLFIDSNGYQNYGRMVVQSESAELLLLNLQKIVWLFNLQDKQKMAQNCKNRQAIQTVRFLRNRFNECQAVKLKCKMNN